MSTISRFEDIAVWQSARAQANRIFLIYSQGNFCKDYELKNQINSSSGSVMDNIAEGFERSGNKEFIQFLIIAKASNGEVRSQLYRAFDRKYINETEFNKLLNDCIEISKKLTAFIKYLKNSDRKGFRYS